MVVVLVQTDGIKSRINLENYIKSLHKYKFNYANPFLTKPQQLPQERPLADTFGAAAG